MRRLKNVHRTSQRAIRSGCTVLAIAALLTTAAGAAHAETVLITGANRGLGLEFARQYAADGWQVIGTARRPAAATELQALDVRVLQLDVTDQASVDALAAALDGETIDLLINNAGILPPADSIVSLDIDTFEQVLAVNTTGPVRVTQALLPNIKRGDGRKIVQITSQLGSIGNNSSGRFYGYRESKAALNMFNRSLAVELRSDNITCIVIHPGWVQTDMGGPNAPLQAPASVAGMREVIADLDPADSGTFWTHAGEQLPW